jgi:hypothetical protein
MFSDRSVRRKAQNVEYRERPAAWASVLFTVKYICGDAAANSPARNKKLNSGSRRASNKQHVWSILGDIEPGANFCAALARPHGVYRISLFAEASIINSGASWISRRSPQFPLLIREILCINETRTTRLMWEREREPPGPSNWATSASPMQMTCFPANKTICRPGGCSQK